MGRFGFDLQIISKLYSCVCSEEFEFDFEFHFKWAIKKFVEGRVAKQGFIRV